jgi:hypothetical protein
LREAISSFNQAQSKEKLSELKKLLNNFEQKPEPADLEMKNART